MPVQYVLEWQLKEHCLKCSNFIRVLKPKDEDDDVLIEVRESCPKVCPYMTHLKFIRGSELIDMILKKYRDTI